MDISEKKCNVDGIEFKILTVQKKKPNSKSYCNLIVFIAVLIAILLIFRCVFEILQPSYTNLEQFTLNKYDCNSIFHEINYLEDQINELRKKLKKFESEIVPEKISEALEVYDSDQIGLFDYAAEYAGGSILDIPQTKPYPLQKITIFKNLEYEFFSKPEIILKTTHLPGDCFVFCGNKGRIQIKLNKSIMVTHVSLEHIKFIEEDIKSAPRDFQIFGFDKYWQFLGNFTYNINKKRIQTFPINDNRKINYIELNIINNYGNHRYTSIYRFRVHSRKFS